ncbi:MAG: hypothetical protein E6Q97_37145 [Desulfurellales bacterium]|nr:MAG: hypothetical protein E6Q97_37145 [Desulfurellales bacterium]
MATAEELLAAVTAAAKKTADGGVLAFRENEDSASMIPLNQYAALIRALADDEVQATINAASATPLPKFTYLC